MNGSLTLDRELFVVPLAMQIAAVDYRLQAIQTVVGQFG